MIDDLMIARIVITVLCVFVVFTLGMVCGQHSVWLSLREKGHVTIDEWFYTAVKVKEGQYKRWE